MSTIFLAAIGVVGEIKHFNAALVDYFYDCNLITNKSYYSIIWYTLFIQKTQFYDCLRFYFGVIKSVIKNNKHRLICECKSLYFVQGITYNHILVLQGEQKH